MRKRKLTEKQMHAYILIAHFIDENGYPPTNKELGRMMGINGSNAKKHIDALYLKGAVQKKHRSARGIILCLGE